MCEATGNEPPVSSDKNPEPNPREPIGPRIADTGRLIDEIGGFDLEIVPDRTRDDIFNNRPGRQLREKILNLPDLPGVYMYVDRYGKTRGKSSLVTTIHGYDLSSLRRTL